MKKILISVLIILLGIFILLGIKLFFDDSSKTAIDAIEKIRGDKRVDYVIQEAEILDGEIIFYLHYDQNGNKHFEIDYVKKTWRGWKWVYGGGMGTNEETVTNMYLPSTEGSEFGKSPFPIMSGIICNPDISRVVVRDYVNHLEKQAKIIEVDNQFKIYYVFLNQSQGEKFDVIAYDKNGEKLDTQTIDGFVDSSFNIESLQESQ